jgi:hypothetical protein
MRPLVSRCNICVVFAMTYTQELEKALDDCERGISAARAMGDGFGFDWGLNPWTIVLDAARKYLEQIT